MNEDGLRDTRGHHGEARRSPSQLQAASLSCIHTVSVARVAVRVRGTTVGKNRVHGSDTPYWNAPAPVHAGAHPGS